MSDNIDLLRDALSQIYPRRPALKKKMLKTVTDILITTPSNRLPNIVYADSEIEKCFVDVLTKYVKRTPTSANNLNVLCEYAIRLSNTVLAVLNTHTSSFHCIESGYNNSFTNSNIIYDKVKINLSGEENETW